MSIDRMSAMSPMEPLSSTLAADGRKKARENGASEFSGILSGAIQNAMQTEAVDRGGIAALLSGEDIEPHESMIQSTNAELALNLAIQIRNKVIDAYNEVMRMSV